MKTSLFKNSTYFFLTLTFLILLSLPFAQKNQANSQQTTTTPDQTGEEIKEIREAVKKKVQEKIEQITTSAGLNEKRSWYGVIQSITDQEIEITGKKDQTRTIRLTTDTDIVDLKRQNIDVTVLKPNQPILAMGTILGENLLETTRLLVISTPSDWSQTKVIYAIISDISTTSEVLVLTPIQNKDEQYEVKITSTTKSESKFTNFKIGQKVIVVLTQSENGKLTYTARRLEILKENLLSPTPPTQE